MATIDFNITIDDDLYNKYYNEYDSGNYTGAIKTSVLYLTDCIRERTNLDLDGDKLILQSFSVSSPLIRLNDLKTETEKNEQIGTMMMLQGIYKAIRNPRNHDLKVDNRFTCDSIIILINYFICIVKKAKLLFDYDEFYAIVDDVHFDKSIEYSDEIIKNIPTDKFLDTTIRLIDNINDNNFENISFILYSSLKIFNENDLRDFLKFCENILSRTHDHSTIKALVFSLRDNWRNLEKSVCMRIENILFDAIKKIEITHSFKQDGFFQTSYFTITSHEAFLAKYITYLPRPFTKQSSNILIYSLIKDKIQEGDDYIDYLFDHFSKFLFSESNHLYPTYNDLFIKLLNSGNAILYNQLMSGQGLNNEFEPYYSYDEEISIALNNFKKKK